MLTLSPLNCQATLVARKEAIMSEGKNLPYWYRFLHPSPHTTTPLSILQDKSNLTEVKIITKNDLKVETILIEEFKYRGESLKQVSSEFATTLNLYLIFIGISASGFGVIYQLSGTRSYLQLLEILVFLALGMASFGFFVRMIQLIRNSVRDKACMDLIREYYIEQLQSQIPDISTVFRISLDNSEYNHFRSIIYSIFAFADSLCFASAAFVLTELWLHINSVSPFPLLPLPSDMRPYIIGLLVGTIALLSQLVFLRIILHQYINKYYK
jgi:hypothetical protein